jgi:hypothetical protein
MEVRRICKLKYAWLLFLFIAVFFLAFSCMFYQPDGVLNEIQEEAEAENDKDGTSQEISSGNMEDKSPQEPDDSTVPANIWIEEAVPAAIKKDLLEKIKGNPDFISAGDRFDADVLFEIVPAGAFTDGESLYRDLGIYYLMAPVAGFFNIEDEIKWDDFRDWWNGDSGSLDYVSDSSTAVSLYTSEEDYRILVKIMGEPANENIEITPGNESISKVQDNDAGISIIPFDSIVKELKVLDIDGITVFDPYLSYEDYPLAFSVIIHGKDADIVESVYSCYEDIDITNRDMSKFTSLMMTGVTAMARSKVIGRKMDEAGALYPAEKIADVLKSADITHISNEIPFVEGCPGKGWPIFCSDPEYMELLRFIDPEVIELTGNHMNDYGHDWMLYTLDLYDEEGWPYFGGGRNLDECYRPAVLESKGHKFAFLGLNWFGPRSTYATQDSPGCAPGPQEQYFKKFEEIIGDLKENGYIVIFTFQYLEVEQYFPTGQQVVDFRRMIDAGADIVSGSQAHYPMGVELYNNGFINYGLGNLFFNMGNITGLRQGIIARHIFYDGRHINTVLITTMLEDDLSQVRLTTPEERRVLLKSIFEGSIR